MRYVVALAVALALTVGVGTAHAGCGCKGYAKTVKRDGMVAFDLWMRLGASGLKPRQSTRVVKGVKKYARHGQNLPNTPWCLRSQAHAKACKAAVACAAAAGPVWLTSIANGDSTATAARNAEGACVGAVLAVYLVA